MSTNTIRDVIMLQFDIDNLVRWCKINLLRLNPKKCHQMAFRKNNNPLQCNYTLDNHPLHRADSIKDLGVTFDAKLSF